MAFSTLYYHTKLTTNSRFLCVVPALKKTSTILSTGKSLGVATTNTWCMPQLEKAEEMGYVIQTIHEVWHFRETRVRLFEDYVNTWLKLKTEASGWSAWCDMEEKKQPHMTQFQEKEGIVLEYEKIAVIPGQWALAKLMLNSMWGKFGQQVNKMQVKEFIEPQAFCSFMDSDFFDADWPNDLSVRLLLLYLAVLKGLISMFLC